MKIGIFDSGLGGLVIMQALLKSLPKYEYVYYGDTRNAPYGDKTHREIYQHTQVGVEFLFKQGCQLVIIACNSASAHALRELQQTWLPNAYPERKLLGVMIPIAEAIVDAGYMHVGIIATTATVSSGAYEREIHKLNPAITVISKATPCLVPLIEEGESAVGECVAVAKDAFLDVEIMIPGCTHYPLIKEELEQFFNKPFFDAPACVATSLQQYLERHSEIERLLSRTGTREFWVTQEKIRYPELAERIMGQQIQFQLVHKDAE